MFDENLRKFYENQNIFLTGGTGFLGKAIIEKLSRSCPNFGKIYMLMRPKRSANINERLNKFLEEDVFLRLQTVDKWKDKIVPISGDVSKLNCGLSEDDLQLLKSNVNIIFHCAATVRFDDPLQQAILTNTRGTREICKLALEMINLKIMVYVSTAYSNMDKRIVDEVIYPPPAEWKEMITMCEETDPTLINAICSKLLQGYPNTYVFAKALSEQVVNDMCQDKIPTLILRPSIVIGAISEPIPGWSDNFNGPYGICIGTGKGILHTYLGDENVRLNVIPVDTVVQTILMASYYKLNTDVNNKKLEMYNICSNEDDLMSLASVRDICQELMNEYPFKNILWYPFLYITGNKYLYFFLVVIYHLLPAILIDFLMRLFGTKPFLFKLQRKIYIANTVLKPFSTYEWMFLNNNFLKLVKWANSHESNKNFTVQLSVNHKDMLKDAIIATSLYVLKEGAINKNDSKRMFRMKILHFTTKYVLIFLILYFVFVKWNVLQVALTKIVNYYKDIQLN